MNPYDEPEHEVCDFRWWPEIAGAIGVALLVWSLIFFGRGSL